MKIGILGTRGIPNRYGGFEQFAEQLAVELAGRGHDVAVYNSSLHGYREKEWKGVKIITCRDPENRLGTAGQFFYDLNCLNDARRRQFEVLLHLGYTSDSLWRRRWPANCLHVVNMDGLEWKRAKYGPLTRMFLKKAEKWAVLGADQLVADNPAIQSYLEKKYGLKVPYIPYPVAPLKSPPPSELVERFGLPPALYLLVIARMEPENHIEMIIRARLQSASSLPLLIVGNTGNAYGDKLKRKFESEQIRFAGALYDKPLIDALRYHCALYVHGHSVGGTNPSLLEAMACGCPIAAHHNIFNRAVLKEKGMYFSDEGELGVLMSANHSKMDYDLAEYEMEKVVVGYERVFRGQWSIGNRQEAGGGDSL